MNTFGYVVQNPLSFIDPYGLLPDAIVDLGLIAFDIASLKANTIGLLIPGTTGLWLGIRAVGVTNMVKPNAVQQRNLERFSGRIPADS